MVQCIELLLVCPPGKVIIDNLAGRKVNTATKACAFAAVVGESMR